MADSDLVMAFGSWWWFGSNGGVEVHLDLVWCGKDGFSIGFLGLSGVDLA